MWWNLSGRLCGLWNAEIPGRWWGAMVTFTLLLGEIYVVAG